MAKKSKSAAPSPGIPSSKQPQEAAEHPSQHVPSQHVPPNAQPLSTDLISPKPLLKVAKEKSSGGDSKELWLIQVPRNVGGEEGGSCVTCPPCHANWRKTFSAKRAGMHYAYGSCLFVMLRYTCLSHQDPACATLCHWVDIANVCALEPMQLFTC
eukprot:1143318-Pelagomonas_calceolata.AAC.2